MNKSKTVTRMNMREWLKKFADRAIRRAGTRSKIASFSSRGRCLPSSGFYSDDILSQHTWARIHRLHGRHRAPDRSRDRSQSQARGQPLSLFRAVGGVAGVFRDLHAGRE